MSQPHRPVDSALASVLRSGREEFNARFALARRLHPDLDGNAFSAFLRDTLNEVVQVVEKVRADRVPEVVMAAYDAALELVAQKLVGPGARHVFVEQAWRRILPSTASLVSAAPAKMLAAVSNAVHRLATTAGARPEEWIAALEKLGPQCADVEQFLKLGQLLAWRAGMAHFRHGAIAAADALPEGLILSAIQANPGSVWSDLRSRLVANPWFDPAAAPQDHSRLRLVARAGAFRGFGGLFPDPPRVAASGEQFLVRSGESCWLLTADAFGAIFHRASLEEFSASSASKLPRGLKVSGSHMILGQTRMDFPELGDFSSVAANTTTLALTSGFTHGVVLLALPEIDKVFD